MFCIECGQSIEPYARFCKYCGTKVEVGTDKTGTLPDMAGKETLGEEAVPSQEAPLVDSGFTPSGAAYTTVDPGFSPAEANADFSAAEAAEELREVMQERSLEGDLKELSDTEQETNPGKASTAFPNISVDFPTSQEEGFTIGAENSQPAHEADGEPTPRDKKKTPMPKGGFRDLLKHFFRDPLGGTLYGAKEGTLSGGLRILAMCALLCGVLCQIYLVRLNGASPYYGYIMYGWGDVLAGGVLCVLAYAVVKGIELLALWAVEKMHGAQGSFGSLTAVVALTSFFTVLCGVVGQVLTLVGTIFVVVLGEVLAGILLYEGIKTHSQWPPRKAFFAFALYCLVLTALMGLFLLVSGSNVVYLLFA